MIEVIRESVIMLLVHEHISEIKIQIFCDRYLYSCKKPVLIKGIILNFFTKMEHNFIRYYQSRKLWIIKYAKSKRG